MKVEIEIPDEIYEDKADEIEKIIARTDEELGRISKEISTKYPTDETGYGTYERVERYMENHRDDETSVLVLVKPKELLDQFKLKVEESFTIIYKKGYSNSNDGFVNVLEINVVQTPKEYVIFAYVEYGSLSNPFSEVHRQETKLVIER